MILILLLAAVYLYLFFLRSLSFWFKNSRARVLRTVAALLSLGLCALCLNIYSVMAVVVPHFTPTCDRALFFVTSACTWAVVSVMESA